MGCLCHPFMLDYGGNDAETMLCQLQQRLTRPVNQQITTVYPTMVRAYCLHDYHNETSQITSLIAG